MRFLLVISLVIFFGYSNGAVAQEWSTPEAMQAFGKPGDTVNPTLLEQHKKHGLYGHPIQNDQKTKKNSKVKVKSNSNLADPKYTNHDLENNHVPQRDHTSKSQTSRTYQYSPAASSTSSVSYQENPAYRTVPRYIPQPIGGNTTSSNSKDLGNYSANPYDPDSTSNPYGAGSAYNANSVNNPYGIYGSTYSNESAKNPYATDAPKLYDREGNYRGKLSNNPYDPDSISNPYGQYGSKYSPDSINNPYGAGNPYSSDSPNNPYGSGWHIEGK